jgi:hypothetical protein
MRDDKYELILKKVEGRFLTDNDRAPAVFEYIAEDVVATMQLVSFPLTSLIHFLSLSLSLSLSFSFLLI